MSAMQARTTLKDGLLIVTLANPDGNRMNRAVLRGLQEALIQAKKPDVRAVLLKAEGAVFSLGSDVS
jgi:enoyl-CoA hydratase/carnithine racemase